MYTNVRNMKDRPATERPYEKCLESGAESLSNGELLAVVLRSGTRGCSALDLAFLLLEKHPVHKGLAGLYHLTYPMLTEIPGIGKVKAVELLCILELSKRLSRASLEAKCDFSAPEYVASYYMEEMRHLDREKVKLLLLDGKHRLMREVDLSEGSANAAFVSLRSVFVLALRYEAVHLILLHNHPSGDPEPSKEDLSLTARIQQAGDLVGIPLTDHIVIGDQCFISMREEGMMRSGKS